MKKILWSVNHRFIVEITSSLDGYFYCIVHPLGYDAWNCRIGNACAGKSYKWAFTEAVKAWKENHEKENEEMLAR